MWSKMSSFYRDHRLMSSMGLFFVLYGSGDLSRQTIQGQKKYNLTSAVNMGLVAACLMAPLGFRWYKFLDQRFTGTAWKTVAQKVALDQCFMGTVAVFFFYTGNSVLERKEDVLAEWRAKRLKTFMTGCCYWPVMQSLNFRFVLPTYRLPYFGSVAYVWTIILSFIKSDHSFEHDPDFTKNVKKT